MSMQQREYTTPQAYERFGTHLKYRTAVRRAQLAFTRGHDNRIRMIAGAFVAPEEFWRDIFARPAIKGRPRHDEPLWQSETRDAQLG